jgi:heat shock protein HslJ
MKILFAPNSCVDKQSQQRFDYRVEVDIQGKNYMGCGVSLQQLALLQDIWVLTDFEGKRLTSNNTQREVPRLEISLTEGRVTGTTGCNRLSGPVRADTRTIVFGPLVTTKMACVGEGGILEGDLLSALNQPLTYRVSEGKLTLLRGSESVMVFKKVD